MVYRHGRPTAPAIISSILTGGATVLAKRPNRTAVMPPATAARDMPYHVDLAPVVEFPVEFGVEALHRIQVRITEPGAGEESSRS
jgi:hypothetical protein